MPAPNIQSIVDDAARRNGIPVEIFRALVNAESGYNPRAVSPAGARGLTQLMPGTARGLGVTDSFNPQQAADGGARYLKSQYDRFKDWSKALAAYNAGPGNVEKYGGIPPFAETQAYVKRIMQSLGNAPLAPAGQGVAPGAGVDQGGVQTPTAAGTTGLTGNNYAQVDKRQRVQSALEGIAKGTGAFSFKLPELSPVEYLQTATSVPGVSAVPTSDNAYGSEGPPATPGTILGSVFKMGGGPADHAKRPMNNWQSDNAYDLLVPVGTPVYAVSGGVIDSRFGKLSDSGKTAGFRLTIDGKDNRFFYQHLSRYAPGIKPGARVKPGQLIGYSGSAVGVPHLHFGVEHGDPARYFERT